ncbi:MAG: nucleotidyltransferase family protein [Phenylobacterium sp.]|uniref:nucleotidyltransferase family protein n=1 Tax=Phenylobacterium sp. TaxID=1871053 RepID=UPI002731C651|nr:nucleotidyltransferase family protein [Phenylobacterium sp.]MDP2011728.1 nucleotidyltransferase family protein [Phenylobacterium sp.]
MAAGAGTRFGGGKLLAPYGDGVLLEGALRAAFAAPVRTVTVVTGSDPSRVGAAVMAYARQAGQDERLKIVHAADHAEGMGASLRHAAAALPADAEGVYVFLGDMPRIPASVLEPLSQAVRDGAPAAAATFGGKRGHPALIGAALIPQLLTLTGDAGARAVLQGLGERLALVEAPDDGVLFDVDKPADLPGSIR